MADGLDNAINKCYKQGAIDALGKLILRHEGFIREWTELKSGYKEPGDIETADREIDFHKSAIVQAACVKLEYAKKEESSQ